MQVINELASYSIILKTWVFILLLYKLWVFPDFTLSFESKVCDLIHLIDFYLEVYFYS